MQRVKYKGKLRLGKIEFDCYVNEDNKRLLKVIDDNKDDIRKGG